MRLAPLLGIALVAGAAACSGGPSADTPGGRGRGAPDTIDVAPSDGTFDLAVSLQAQGAGSQTIGKFAVDAGVGTVEVRGRSLPAFAIAASPLADGTSTGSTFDLLVVAPDAVYAVYLYCWEGSIYSVYFEGSDGTTMSSEAASGACAQTDAVTTVRARLPAIRMQTPPLIDGVVFRGPDLVYEPGKPGTVLLDDGVMTFMPFSTVDCSRCRGDGYETGWFEVHALVWNREKGTLGFAIFYLTSESPDYVHVDYAAMMPGPRLVQAQTLAASWSWERPMQVGVDPS